MIVILINLRHFSYLTREIENLDINEGKPYRDSLPTELEWDEARAFLIGHKDPKEVLFTAINLVEEHRLAQIKAIEIMDAVRTSVEELAETEYVKSEIEHLALVSLEKNAYNILTSDSVSPRTREMIFQKLSDYYFEIGEIELSLISAELRTYWNTHDPSELRVQGGRLVSRVEYFRLDIESKYRIDMKNDRYSLWQNLDGEAWIFNSATNEYEWHSVRGTPVTRKNLLRGVNYFTGSNGQVYGAEDMSGVYYDFENIANAFPGHTRFQAVTCLHLHELYHGMLRAADINILNEEEFVDLLSRKNSGVITDAESARLSVIMAGMTFPSVMADVFDFKVNSDTDHVTLLDKLRTSPMFGIEDYSDILPNAEGVAFYNADGTQSEFLAGLKGEFSEESLVQENKEQVIANVYTIIDNSKKLDFDLMEESGDYTLLYGLFDSVAKIYGAEFDEEGKLINIKDQKPLDLFEDKKLNDRTRNILAIYEENINHIYDVEDEGRQNMRNAVEIMNTLEGLLVVAFESNPSLSLSPHSPEAIQVLSLTSDEVYQQGYLLRGVSKSDYHRLMNNRAIQSSNPEAELSLRDHIVIGATSKDTRFISFTSDVSKARDIFGEEGRFIIVRRNQLKGNLLTAQEIESKVKGDTQAMSLVRKNHEFILEPSQNNPAEIPITSLVR